MSTTFANTIDGNDIFAKRAECDAAGNTLSTTYATKAELPTIPTIVGLTAGANVSITESNNAITIAATDTTYSAGTGLSLSGTTFSNADPLPAHTSTESGKVLGVDSNGDLGWVNQSGGGGTTYTAGDGIDITSDVISADVDGTTIGIDSSTKKIKLLSTIPSVDQTYSAASTNAQSGTAVAGAIATKEDAFDVGTGLEMDTSGATPTLQVEAPVDIVAGPGIVIDNPDGNTLRVSQQYPTDETELWENSDNTPNKNISLSESYSNFETLKFIWSISKAVDTTPSNFNYGKKITYIPSETLGVANKFTLFDMMPDGTSFNSLVIRGIAYTVASTTSFTVKGRTQVYYNGSGWNNNTTANVFVYKVVGIHRIANN